MVLSKLQLKGMTSAAYALCLAMVSCVSLNGCGSNVSQGGDVNTFSSAASVSGTIHGGQLPVSFATVRLFAAGTTGYGVGSTLLATTQTSDPTGNFNFTKSATNGSSSVTGPTWACPATSDDPQIYIMATGGNSQGNHLNDSAHTNGAIALLFVLGPCSKISNNMFVILDEFSTVATVFALTPYINPGTTAGTETIGTNGANLPTGTPQAAIGLNNAVAGIANLATNTPPTYTGTAASTSNITVTATAEQYKVNTIADILAACINTTTLPSTNCTQLFNAALSLSGTKPVDTIQAAYYMATNPSDLGTFTACGTPTTNLGCLYALAAATAAPFQNTLAVAPTDWTIGVTYSSTGSCTGQGGANGLFIDGPSHAAVDVNGNVWVINQAASGATAALVEMSPVGAPLLCLTPGSQTYGSSVTIDPTGNVWGLWSHRTVTNELQEIPYNSTSATYATGSPVAYTPLGGGGASHVIAGLVADGYGNIFYTDPASGGTLYEIPNPGTSTTAVTQLTAASSLNGSSTSSPYASLAADTQGRIWGITLSSPNLLGAYPTTAPITAYSVASNVVTFTVANSFTSGEKVEISGLSTANGAQFNGQTLTLTSATSSSVTAAFTAANVSTTTDAGTALAAGSNSYTVTASALDTYSNGLALGGTGASSTYLYTGTLCCGSTHAAEKYQSASTAVASTGAAAAPYLGGNTGANAVAVDGAGNMWIGQTYPESTGSTATSGVMGLAEISAVTGSGPTNVTFSGISPTGTALTNSTCTNSGGCPSNGGFQKSAFTTPLDIEIDPSGNVWVLNSETLGGGGYVSGTASTITEVVGAATPISTPLSVAAKNGKLGAKP